MNAADFVIVLAALLYGAVFLWIECFEPNEDVAEESASERGRRCGG